jgi:hypothetical protein
MNLSDMLSRFRGSRQERARAELDKRARLLADNVDVSLDVSTVAELDGLLAGAGLDSGYLEGQIGAANKRRQYQADLAGSEKRLQELDTAKRQNLADAERLGAESWAAARRAMQSERDHESLRNDLRRKQEFLLNTSSTAEQLTAAGARFHQHVTQYENSKRQMSRYVNYKDLRADTHFIGESKQNSDLCRKHYQDAAAAHAEAVEGLKVTAAEIATLQKAAFAE